MNTYTKKLRRLSQVGGQKKIDSVGATKHHGEYARAMGVLLEARRSWDAMSRFRKDRERCKRYTYGDQWKDVVNVDGKTMTEEKYIMEQGSVPLKNNLIRRLVRNVLGAYLKQTKEPVCVARDRDEQRLGETMSTILQYNMQLNSMTEIGARSMEEFVISGLTVQHKSYGVREGRLDCWTRIVNPSMFFLDSNSQDVRGWDVSIVGEIHDIDLQTLFREFAGSRDECERLREIYRYARDGEYVSSYFSEFPDFGYSDARTYDFFTGRDPRRCRVIEVWRKETKERYLCHDPNNGEVYKIETEDYGKMVEAVNRERMVMAAEQGIPEEDVPLIEATWFVDDYWYFYYLSPFGHILKEGETPYHHKSHPYVFKAYPFIDGEIHSFVSDVIDQQRYTNRLITLYDWVMRSSAKGVLLIPEDSVPANSSIEEFAEEWSRFNGVIAFTPNKQGVLPQQISSNATNIGIGELLNIQLKLFEDVSGVHGALQGKPGFAGMSSSLYAQQTQNATNSLVDLMDSFSAFTIQGAYKDVKNIQQFYDEKRVVNIAGNDSSLLPDDPRKIRDIEFDLSIAESSSSPAYRQLANEFLLEVWKAGQITLNQLLEVGDFPFADKLLQSLDSQAEQMKQGIAPEGISPEMQQQAMAMADPAAVEMAHRALTAN